MEDKLFTYVRENRKNKNRVVWTELKPGALSKNIDQNDNAFPQKLNKSDFDNFTATKSQQMHVTKSLLFKYSVIAKEVFK